MGHSGIGLKFLITIDLQIFSNQIPNSVLNNFFSNFVLYSKGRHYIQRTVILELQGFTS